MTRVATPENEATVLMWAQHSTASHMEKLARLYKRYGEEAPALAQHREDVSAETRIAVINDPPAHPDEDVSAETRRARNKDTGAPIEDPDAPALPRETIRRLGCEAGLVPVLHDGDEILSVGRKTRAVPPSIRRALRLRDRGCRFPGCTHTRHVDAHHVKHWADGERIPEGPVPFALTGHPVRMLEHSNRRLGVSAETHRSRWDEAAPDYSTAIEMLDEYARASRSGG